MLSLNISVVSRDARLPTRILTTFMGCSDSLLGGFLPRYMSYFAVLMLLTTHRKCSAVPTAEISMSKPDVAL